MLPRLVAGPEGTYNIVPIASRGKEVAKAWSGPRTKVENAIIGELAPSPENGFELH